AAQYQRGKSACGQGSSNLGEALRRPAACTAERARSGHQEHRLTGQPDAIRPRLVFGRDVKLQARLARMLGANQAGHVEPVIDLVLDAEAMIGRGFGEKPVPAAVVQSDTAACTAAIR